ncbi:hypothetical protein AB4179_01070 [Vibrio lentus]|uniref:hypothetical protein n=2 Tax=Vibrio TaxID=662 RepID=UPI000C828E39|nr:hypothetical protein [Vibrio splendidus]PMO18379.1 hypothetical protein BCT15_22130 [Vibrio splendidus]PTP80121.1 hypothetical protein CWO06_01715 [Vibrio splendidus]
MLDKSILHWKKIKQMPLTLISNVKDSLPLWHAKGWQKFYFVKNWLFSFKSKYAGKLGFVLVVGLMVVTATLVPALQVYLEPRFDQPERLASFKALFLSLGGAMIGATAIAFSLIMFAMQVNVERMPHGLFRKFSSDTRLLGAFIATFSLAVIIPGFSLIPDKSWVAGATVVTIWCMSLIILLFILAYRRALALISPTMQLKLVVADTKRDFEIWDKAISRTKPILRANASTEKVNEDIMGKYDMDRLTYFQLYPNWAVSAEQAISYCITYSRRHAEQGDHEVSRVALNGIVAINAFYIKTKGKTFFPNSPFIDNPLASDSFLTNTLEHLRQNVQVGVSRKDEQFIEQNLHSLLKLTQLYLSIEYGEEYDPRSHAHLVSGYLTGAVESVVPHDMADVLIEGVSVLGSAARLIVVHDKPEYIASISEKIALIACTGTVNKNYQPVSQVAVKQLATLTFELLRSKSWEVRYAVKEVRDDVKLIADMYLKIPDSPLTRVHSSSLAPYYSGTSNDTLMAWLSELVNALSMADADDENAQRVVHHLEEWADGLYQTEKEVLLQAIEKRSQLTFDLIHWVVHTTKLLLAVSCSDICDDHHRDKLRKSASWLISVLSWIPDDEGTIKYIETYRIADNIFESAVDAHKRGCDIEALEIRSLLLSWTRKVGKYQTGWASLETACCGLACLNLILEFSDEKLFTDIDAYISMNDAPNFDIRSRAASGLHKKADNFRSGYGHSNIDMAMVHADQSRLSILLHGIAERLCSEIPDTGTVEG